MLAALALTAAPSGAHDFWIQPATFTPHPGERIDVHLYVGDATTQSELVRLPAHAVRFDAIAAARSTAIPGFARQRPAGYYRSDAPGRVTLVYQSRPERIALPATTFEEYLREKGLEDVLEGRARWGESARTASESYQRACKALLHVGDPPRAAAQVSARVDLPLELTAERDPSTWHPPETLAFTLHFEGAPLAGRLVELVDLDDPTQRLDARSDPDGRVRFAPPHPGRWMVAAVHMRRAAAEVGTDWESFWATLTFALPDADARPG